MRLVMQPIEVSLCGLRDPAESDLGVQVNARHGELAIGVLLKESDGIVLVAIDKKAFVRREGEESQHVTTRERRDKSRLGIDTLWITQIGARGGAQNLDPVVEAPNVIATVILLAEIGAVARPFDLGFVLGH
jgi:hypothetical protein